MHNRQTRGDTRAHAGNNAMTVNSFLESIPDLAPLFENADYTDVYTAESKVDLRTFIARLMSYQPGWLRMLYRVRAVLVRLLGMRQAAMGNAPVAAEHISFTPGDPCRTFTVTCGRDGEYLAVHHADKHLRADLLMAREWLGDGINRFHVGTIVHHAHWTGPVYFAIIRPFHHLVVKMTMRAATKA
jgi:hypothetical protein